MGLTTYRIERNGADRLLVLLHGRGAEQHHLAAYVPLVDPNERYRVVSPRAPHRVAGTDGASWYVGSGLAPDPTSFLATVEMLDAFVATELATAGLTSEQCVLGGFSQGGLLALVLAGRVGAPRYDGVWAMCSALPEVNGLVLDLGAASGTAALVQYGRRDRIVTPERSRSTATALRDHGWDVTEAGYDMAHSQTIEMMVDARRWLAGLP